jgi:hypothetical protein
VDLGAYFKATFDDQELIWWPSHGKLLSARSDNASQPSASFAGVFALV